MQCQRSAVKIGTLANSLWRYAVLPSTLWQQLALLMWRECNKCDIGGMTMKWASNCGASMTIPYSDGVIS